MQSLTCKIPQSKQGKCIICRGSFYKARPRQIICASLRCKRERNRQRQRVWRLKQKSKPRGIERFPGEYILCLICREKTQRIRIDQATCHSINCLKKHRDLHKFRGIKADHVRNLG